MMKHFNLQRFAGTLTVTVTKDLAAHWTAASASPASSLAEGDTVTLTATPATGYKVDEIRVLAGGVTIEKGASGYSFTMGESNVTLLFLAKASGKYRIIENTFVNVNGVKTELQRNMMIEYSNNGAVIGVNGESTSISLSADIIQALKDSGAIVDD